MIVQPSTSAARIAPGVLVARLCRASGLDEVLERHVMALADDAFLEEFASCAVRERVLGLLLESISSSPQFWRLPSATRDTLLTELSRLRHEGTFWDLQSEHLVSVLSAKGCEPVLLKGGALRRTVYQGPADRPVADLDILVQRQNIDRTVDALERFGYAMQPSKEMRAAYEEHHFHLVFQNRQGFIVEVHWDLTSPHSTYRFEPDEFVNHAIALDQPRGGVIRVPRPEHTFLHIVGQLAIEYPYLGRLIDLDRLIRTSESFDWQFLVTTAERYGLTNALALWIVVLRRMLETPVPPLVNRVVDRVSGLVRLHLAVLEVPTFMTMQQRRASEAMVALRLWQWPDGSRFRHFVVLFGRRGQLDEEAAALMHGENMRARSGHFVLRHYRGLKDVAKLVGYQVWLYLRALQALVLAARPSPFALWSEVPHV